MSALIMGLGKHAPQRLRYAGLIGLGAVLTILGLPPALAQGSAGNEAERIEEIVVTSTRREIGVQEVPQSITVLTGAELAAKSIMSVDDYANFVPGLNFNRTGFGDRNGLDLTVRGVSNTRLTDINAGTAALTTGFYIDEVAVNPVDPFLYDVERVEFVKGPQGTLFGQASMGGTVRVITRKPDPTQFEASSEVALSGTQGGANPSWAFRGAINIPLIEDTLAVRAVGYTDEQKGFIDWRPLPLEAGAARGRLDGVPENFPNPLDGLAQNAIVEDVNLRKANGARLALQYTPNDSLTITPMVMRQEKHQDFLSTVDANLEQEYFLERYIPIPRTEIFDMGALTVEYDFAFATLTSVTGTFASQRDWVQDTTTFNAGRFGLAEDGSVASVFPQEFGYDSDIFSQEVRLTSTRDLEIGSLASLEWLVGGAFFEEKREIGIAIWGPTYNANAAPGNEIPGADQGFVHGTHNSATFESLSGFGEATLKFMEERVHLTAGARWFDLESSGVGRTTGGLLNLVGVVREGLSREGGETGVVPRFAAKYFLSDQQMLYVSAAEGFRAGGPGPPAADLIPPACLNALALAGIEPGSFFKSDSIWNYELGIKSQWRDGALVVNAAAFQIDWSDLQTGMILNNFDIGCGMTATTNAGDATIQGGELQVSAVPMEDLTVNFALAYTDAKLEEPPVGVAVGKEGDTLQNSPEWKVTLSGRYDFRVLDNFDGFFRIDTAYTDDLVSSLADQDDPRFQVPSKFVVNMRLGLRPAVDSSWSAELFVNNATNEMIVYGSQFLFGEPQTVQRQVGRPRTIGLLLRKNWGGY